MDNSEALQEKNILGQILGTCHDFDSIKSCRKVIKEVSKFKILSALSQVKEAQALGRVRKSPGAMFTHLIKTEDQIN